MIVAMDEGIRRDLLCAAERENTADVRWYSDRLCAISTFSHYLGDEILAGAQGPVTSSRTKPSMMPLGACSTTCEGARSSSSRSVAALRSAC